MVSVIYKRYKYDCELHIASNYIKLIIPSSCGTFALWLVGSDFADCHNQIKDFEDILPKLQRELYVVPEETNVNKTKLPSYLRVIK